ncbi:MAG TPA: GNAT family N-acetyltransferase [Kofleriaceae bacterium]|nr:GNAT family N-acetyltransferase [Kofleriaceae bacterium]
MTLRWHDRGFDELSIAELYAILSLRERVFIVEQACVYLDADGHDPASRHLWAEDPAAGPTAIRAYLRILPAGEKFAEVGLGRIVVAPEARGTGLGRELVRRALDTVGDSPVRIGAQAHLEKFYGELGFCRVGEPFVEDGIPHLEMIRNPAG